MSTTFTFAALESLTSEQIAAYDKSMLMAAREYVLLVKRTAKQGGFGNVAGRMLREAIGYRFDGMAIGDALAAMSAEGFMAIYAARLATWYSGLNKSAGESTLKSNAKLHSAASALTGDAGAFKRLVNAIRILCVRNQSWQESGNHVALPMNGHKAVLDLFCINVTNARRLSLTAA